MHEDNQLVSRNEKHRVAINIAPNISRPSGALWEHFRRGRGYCWDLPISTNDGFQPRALVCGSFL